MRLILIGLVLASPVIIAILWMSARFASSSAQRVVAMIVGLVGSIGGGLMFASVIEPTPQTFVDDYQELLTILSMAVGATAAIAVYFLVVTSTVKSDKSAN